MSKLKPNIVAALSRIGRNNGTQPQSSRNSTRILHDYYVADVIAKHAKTRVEQAKDAMIKFAMEGGFKPDSVRPGDTVPVVNDDPEYTVTLKVNNPPDKFNITRFKSELVKAGIKQEVIDKAEVLASETGTAAKIYTIFERET